LGDLSSLVTDGTVTVYSKTMPSPTRYESVFFINTLLPARMAFLCNFSAGLTTTGCSTHGWRSPF